MKEGFNYFLDTIPKDIYFKTKSHVCRHMAIFEPEEYTLGEVISVDDYHFLLFFSESPLTRVSGCEYQLKKGGLLVIQPWQEVYGIIPFENRKFGKYTHIAIKKEFFNKIATEAARGDTFEFKHIQGVYSTQLLDLVGNFQREMMNHAETYPLMIESICTQIVFQLIRDLNCKSTADKIGKENKYINAAIDYMQKYYSADISINDICSLIYLSPCHFKRVFKEYTGQTPYQFLMGIRIEKSKEILRKNEHSIEKVARLCGFINSGHFSTVFKRHVNMSPTEFRKINT